MIMYGSTFRALREGKGLKQADVAATMHAAGFGTWCQSTVSSVEHDQRRLSLDEYVTLRSIIGDVLVLSGARAQALRKQARLSQTELAEAMRTRGYDWHQNTVSRVETGKQQLRVETTVALLEIFHGRLLEVIAC